MLKLGDTKVLVQSHFREVTAKTYEDVSRNEKGEIVHKPYFRQFHEHKAWMTPEEADFLVNSDENLAHTEEGYVPLYYFPLGQPAFVKANAKECACRKPCDHPSRLTAPLGEDSLASTDARQADAARRKQEAAERRLKAQEDEALATAGASNGGDNE